MMKTTLFYAFLLATFFTYSQDYTDGLNFATVSGGTEAIVNSYSGSATDVIIPSHVTIGGSTYSVTTIGFEAFKDKQLTSIVVPNTIHTIEPSAFQRNQLESINLPEGITAIEANTFVSNNLKNITIPSTVTRIEADAFSGNELTSIRIPSYVTKIGDYAFDGNPLNTVISLSTEPAILPSTVFSNIGSIDLMIPVGTTSKYMSAGWTGFNSITKEETLNHSSITLDDSKIDINITPSTIYVQTPPETEVQRMIIFSILGNINITIEGNSAEISSLAPGIYILKLMTNKGVFSKKILL